MLKKAVVIAAVMAMAAAAAWAHCGACPGDKAGDKPACKKGEACLKAGDTAYTCLKCSLVNTKAGKCPKCDADMKAAHVLAMDGVKVSLCPCEAGCKCTAKADDPKQCSCGKPVTTLDCATACMVLKKPTAAEPAKPDADTAKPKDSPAR
jgi:hypothetical protein